MSNGLSGETEYECTVSYAMHSNDRIHCATELGDLLLALVLQWLWKEEIRASLR